MNIDLVFKCLSAVTYSNYDLPMLWIKIVFFIYPDVKKNANQLLKCTL